MNEDRMRNIDALKEMSELGLAMYISNVEGYTVGYGAGRSIVLFTNIERRLANAIIKVNEVLRSKE
jgi:uncharacterized protein YebE (UPF0316 family)